MVLAQANGHVGQQGSVADYLEVEPKHERAVEACLGDLLQYVIVPTHAQAEAGLELIRQENVGRCGFVVLEAAGESSVMSGFLTAEASAEAVSRTIVPSGLAPIREVVRITGPHAAAIDAAIPQGFIADDLATALNAARSTSGGIATLTGEVIHGRFLLSGGGKDEGRAIPPSSEVKDCAKSDCGRGAERDQSVSGSRRLKRGLPRFHALGRVPTPPPEEKPFGRSRSAAASGR